MSPLRSANGHDQTAGWQMLRMILNHPFCLEVYRDFVKDIPGQTARVTFLQEVSFLNLRTLLTMLTTQDTWCCQVREYRKLDQTERAKRAGAIFVTYIASDAAHKVGMERTVCVAMIR